MTPPTEEEPTAALLGGRYVLRDSIGRGAMGEVFRADDVVLGRAVAVKLLGTAPDGALLAPRARTEMSLLASLNHHSLVTLYDAMVEPGQTPYLVMELVEGPTLAAELRNGPMLPAHVAQLAVELASALHVVHAAGIVHRDVKPSNILLATDPVPGRRPRAKLADFGVAYLADGERFTSPGMVVGTAAYLAPEQVRGAPPAPAADIYALGLVLRECLTGERAFPDASGIGAITARLIESPSLPDDLGDEWIALLSRMIAFDPEERPDALEVAELAAALPAVTLPRRTAPAPPAGDEPTATALMPSPAAVSDHVSRRDRSGRRRRRRARTIILVGSALAVAAFIGVNAATWVGSVGGGWTTVQDEPAPSETIPADAESVVDAPADTDGDIVPVSSVTTDTTDDTADDGADGGGGTAVDTSDGADDGRVDDKALRKAEHDASKAADAAKREARKQAEEQQREADKQAREAEKQAREAAKDPRKKGKPGRD